MSPPTTPTAMSSTERALLASELGNAKPLLTLRTATRIDTGRWLRRSAVWLCVTDQKLVVLAVSRRTYCESIDLQDCAASHYNHTTGQLVIEPSSRLRFAHLALPPNDALRVIGLIAQAYIGKSSINTCHPLKKGSPHKDIFTYVATRLTPAMPLYVKHSRSQECVPETNREA